MRHYLNILCCSRMVARGGWRAGFGVAALLGLLMSGCARMQVAQHLEHFSGVVVEHPDREPALRFPLRNLVMIQALDAQGQAKQFGTGFYVRSNQVMTCLHVIESADRLVIVLADGSRQPVVGVFGTDPLMDAAVLWVTNVPPTKEGLVLRKSAPKISEPAFALSAVKTLPITASRGTVSELRDLGNDMVNRAIVLTAPILPGFSGGPVLDAQGAVIGMTSQYYVSPEKNECVAIPAQDITGLMEGEPSRFAEWRKSHPRVDFAACLELTKGNAHAFTPAEALPHYEKAISLSPNYSRAWVRKAYCLARLERTSDAISAFQTALKIQPEMITPRVALSFVYSQEKQYAEAIQEAYAVIERRPNAPSGYAALARGLLGQEDYGAALAAGENALRLAPERPESHVTSGVLWLGVGRPEMAVQQFREALRLQPDSTATWLRLGASQMDLNQDVEAVQSLNHVLTNPLAAECASARYGILAIAIRNRETKYAEREFQAFLQEERRFQEVARVSKEVRDLFGTVRQGGWKSPLAHKNQAEIFVKTKRGFEAFLAVETCAQLAPNDPWAWANLAQASYFGWRFERARVAAAMAIRSNPRQPKAYFWMGAALTALGEYDAARAAFRKALEVDGNRSEIFLALACVEAKVGHVEAAKAFLDQAPRLEQPIPQKYMQAPQRFIPDAKQIWKEAKVEVKG